MTNKDIKLIKVSYNISMIFSIIIVILVVIGMSRGETNNVYLSGGAFFIFYFLLNTYAKIKKVFSEENNIIKPLSFFDKLAGVISMLNGFLYMIASLFMLWFLFDKAIYMGFSEILMTLAGFVVILSYGSSLCYYTFKIFKLL